jgi:hypothetical protein
MRRTAAGTVALALIASTTGPAAPAGAQVVGRQVGNLFGDIELPTIERDRTIRLSELRGRRVLLIEFASW